MFGIDLVKTPFILDIGSSVARVQPKDRLKTSISTHLDPASLFYQSPKKTVSEIPDTRGTGHCCPDGNVGPYSLTSHIYDPPPPKKCKYQNHKFRATVVRQGSKLALI
jgi:hypothetical protein